MIQQTIHLNTLKNSIISHIYSKIPKLNLTQLKLLKTYIDNIDDITTINQLFNPNSKNYYQYNPSPTEQPPQPSTPKFKSTNSSFKEDDDINFTFNKIYNNFFNK